MLRPPNPVCFHGRKKASCKECRAIKKAQPPKCPHGYANRQYCKDCNACKHGNCAYSCMICRGPGTCYHRKMKASCPICTPKLACPHGQYKSGCLECNAHKLCPHKEFKTKCKLCVKPQPKRCEHGKIKYDCKDCHGSNFCKHMVRKQYCITCNGRKLCAGCRTVGVQKAGDFCKRFCKPITAGRSSNRETVLMAHFTVWRDDGLIPDLPKWNKTNPLAHPNACEPFLPDFTFDFGTHVVVVEHDENQHKYITATPRCDMLRTAHIIGGFVTADAGLLPVHIIRFNPDGFKIAGADVDVPMEARLELLRIRLGLALIQEPENAGHRVIVEKLYFDQDAPSDTYHQLQRWPTLIEYNAFVDERYPLENVQLDDDVEDDDE